MDREDSMLEMRNSYRLTRLHGTSKHAYMDDTHCSCFTAPLNAPSHMDILPSSTSSFLVPASNLYLADSIVVQGFGGIL